MDKSIQVVTRDAQTGQFDFLQSNFSDPPTSLKHQVTLKVKENVFDLLFSKINWNSIFKDNNDLVNAIVKNFFDSIKSNTIPLGDYLVTKVALD